MVRWLAPILSFTAEEIWRHMPGAAAGVGVLLDLEHGCRPSPRPRRCVNWPALLEARGAVLRELERLRVAGQIGAPLDAVVDLYAAPELRAALDALGEELRFVMITSEARVHAAEARPAEAVPATADGEATLWVQVRPSDRGQVRPLLAQA